MNDPAPIKAQVMRLFETQVLLARLENFESLNRDLKAVIAARKAGHPGMERSNVLGWHSDTDMLLWGGDPARRLGQEAVMLCDRFTTDLGQKDKPRFEWSAEMWANVSTHGCSNDHHAHPGALWSVVYYVDDGYGGATDDALAGELVLHDPRLPGCKMYAPDLVFKGPGGEVQSFVKLVRPATGNIVAFPSWLMHSVRPYLGHRERISIAINLVVLPAGLRPE